MPIDPGIPLGVQTPKIDNPMDAFTRAFALRSAITDQQQQEDQRRLAIQKQRDAQREQADLNLAAQQATDPEDYFRRITAAGHGHLVPIIKKQIGDADDAAEKARKARIDADSAEADYFGTLAASVKVWEKDGPDAMLNAAKTAIQHAQKNRHDVTPIVSALERDPASLPRILDSLIQGSPIQRGLLEREQGAAAQQSNAATAAARLSAEQPILATDAAVKARADAAAVLKNAVTREDYAVKLSRLRPDIRQAFPPAETWTPQSAEAIGRVGMTPEQQSAAAQGAQRIGIEQQNASTSAGQLKVAQAREAREKAAAAGGDVSAQVQTTMKGGKYIDGSTLKTKQDQQAAATLGIPIVSKEHAEHLGELDNARLNQQSIAEAYVKRLPKDPTGRIVAGALLNKLSKVLQTDEYLAASGAWRAAAIQGLRAAAGAKGFRINQAEIAMAVENDIPKITDTVGSALKKLDTLGQQFDNAERSILVRDRSTLATIGDQVAAKAPVRLQLSDGRIVDVPSDKVEEALKRDPKAKRIGG